MLRRLWFAAVLILVPGNMFILAGERLPEVPPTGKDAGAPGEVGAEAFE